MILVDATLLSVNEYLKQYKKIPLTDEPWWLRTPYSKRGNYVHTIDNKGSINYRYCLNKFTGVRPYCIFSVEPSDSLFWCKAETLIDSEIQLFGYKWTILNYEFGNIHVFCNEIMLNHRFDTKTNVWDNSELKRILKEEIEYLLSRQA